MFPDIEEQKLLEALRSNDYSTEDAITELLGTNDKGQLFVWLTNNVHRKL